MQKKKQKKLPPIGIPTKGKYFRCHESFITLDQCIARNELATGLRKSSVGLTDEARIKCLSCKYFSKVVETMIEREGE